MGWISSLRMPATNGYRKQGSNQPTLLKSAFFGLYIILIMYFLYYRDFHHVPLWVLICLNLLGILLSMVPACFAVYRHFSKSTEQTLENFIINDEAFLWSNIDCVALKQSELGNRYLAIYFRDDTPPKGFILKYFRNREEFLRDLKDNGAKKRFEFVEDIDEKEMGNQKYW